MDLLNLYNQEITKYLSNKLEIEIESNISNESISKIIDIEKSTNFSKEISKSVWQHDINKSL